MLCKMFITNMVLQWTRCLNNEANTTKGWYNSSRIFFYKLKANKKMVAAYVIRAGNYPDLHWQKEKNYGYDDHAV